MSLVLGLVVFGAASKIDQAWAKWTAIVGAALLGVLNVLFATVQPATSISKALGFVTALAVFGAIAFTLVRRQNADA